MPVKGNTALYKEAFPKNAGILYYWGRLSIGPARAVSHLHR